MSNCHISLHSRVSLFLHRKLTGGVMLRSGSLVLAFHWCSRQRMTKCFVPWFPFVFMGEQFLWMEVQNVTVSWQQKYYLE